MNNNMQTIKLNLEPQDLTMLISMVRVAAEMYMEVPNEQKTEKFLNSVRSVARVLSALEEALLNAEDCQDD